MIILTGNDLKTGDVIWWTGANWSRHIEDVVAVGDDAASLLATESAAGRVNAAYAVDAEQTPQGIVPAHIKERVRARGPSVRADLGVAAANPNAGHWGI